MRSIISARIAVLALAAPLFITAPALADSGKGKVKKGKRGAAAAVQNPVVEGPIYVDRGGVRYGPHAAYQPNDPYAYRYTRWNQTYREAERLQRQAVRACRRAIRSEAYNIGFRDVDFERGRYVDQIGPRGFRVTFKEVEFEGRRRDWERPVTCIVRRGDRVRHIEGIPEPRRRSYYRSSGYYR